MVKTKHSYHAAYVHSCINKSMLLEHGEMFYQFHSVTVHIKINRIISKSKQIYLHLAMIGIRTHNFSSDRH
jgi:hypothetical protein